MTKYLFVITLVAYFASSTSAQDLVDEVIRNANNVSTKIYQVLKKNTGQNILFCPLSTNVLFSLLLYGANGETLDELKTLLCIGNRNLDFDGIKSVYQNLLRSMKHKSLRLANRLFMRMIMVPNYEFFKLARVYFDTEVQISDFYSEARSTKVINAYIAKSTKFRIKSIVDEGDITIGTSMVVALAAYFKGRWKHYFPDNVHTDFFSSKDTRIRAKMMKATKVFQYMNSSFLNAQVLRLHFKKDEYSMVFILPNEIDGLHDVEEKLGQTTFDEIIHNLTYTVMRVTLPKFKIEGGCDLKGVMKEMGVKSLFDTADFRNITEDELEISIAKQKNYLLVDQNGVDVSAGTDIFTGIKIYWKYTFSNYNYTAFTADHPFVFAILFKGLVIFQGRLYDPESII